MCDKYFPTVVQAVAGDAYTVYAYFSDGKIVCFDMKPLIEKGGVFERLKDPVFFKERITVLNDAVAWDLSGHYDPADCIDIDPFVVYEAEAIGDPLQEAI